MTIPLKASLDTNKPGATTAALILDAETVVTMYLVTTSGKHEANEVILEASPDGIVWVPTGVCLITEGCETIQIAATQVRARVSKAEGNSSSVEIYLAAV